MHKEIVRIGLKKSRNYQTYESTIEKEIYYKTAEERSATVNELFATVRKELVEQMIMDKNGSTNDK